MSLKWISFVVIVYLALLARSAVRQGEFRQFVVSLAILAGLGAVIAAIIWLYLLATGG